MRVASFEDTLISIGKLSGGIVTIIRTPLTLSGALLTASWRLLGVCIPEGLSGKSFAIIADEAHSSQTGETASKLKEAVGGVLVSGREGSL